MSEAADTGEDLYAVLGVPSTASAEEVRAAYRGLAQRYHPDHNPNDPEAARRMQAINQAFTVLNVPERRAEYDRRRTARSATRQPPPDPRRGAGRGQRPYYRGKNWGLHTGADAPPEYIVRAEPSSFNLVVDAVHEPPARTVHVHNDAPFTVRMAAVPSPWLEVSTPVLEVEGGGNATLLVSATPDAAAEQRGWRDGGVSLLTDDPRVFCPDVRVTAIFMGRPERWQQAHAESPDLRDVDRSSSSAGESAKGGWRRLFGL